MLRRNGATQLVLVSALLVVLVVPSPARADFDNQTGTLTRSVTATWALGDARGTVLTITGTVVDDGGPGGVTTTRTGVVRLVQHYCDTSGAQDLWTDIDMTSDKTYEKYVEALPNGYQKGKVAVPIHLFGTITRTPMGRNGTCAVATGPSWTETWDTTGKVSASWEPAAAAAVSDQPSLDHFTWTRQALASGSFEVKVMALKAKLLTSQLTGASLDLVAHTTDLSDASALFTIKS